MAHPTLPRKERGRRTERGKGIIVLFVAKKGGGGQAWNETGKKTITKCGGGVSHERLSCVKDVVLGGQKKEEDGWKEALMTDYLSWGDLQSGGPRFKGTSGVSVTPKGPR